MSRTILATLAIGQRYEALWKNYCQASWESYAERHGFEIKVLTKPLREDPRSPAWQKLCLSDHFSDADAVLFVDADIVFSRHAGNPISMVPSDKIGVVPEPRGANYRRSVRLWAGKTHIMSAPEYYRRTARIESTVSLVYNTGVLVFRPLVADKLFQKVWSDYPETIYYEQPALSHEMILRGLDHALPEDFNTNWSIDRMAFPFFSKLDRIRTDRRNWLHHLPPVRQLACKIRFGCILERLSRCSFLHLSGGQFADLPADWWERHLNFEKAGDL